MTTGKKEIRELALTNSLTDAYLLLQDIKELKRSLSLELDLARDRRVAQEAEFREFMTHLWKTLHKIQAQFRIDATLLHLISPAKAGKTDGNQDNAPITLHFTARPKTSC